MKTLLVGLMVSGILLAGGLCEQWNPTEQYEVRSQSGMRVLCAKLSFGKMSELFGPGALPIRPGFPDQVQVWIWTPDSDTQTTAFVVEISYQVLDSEGNVESTWKVPVPTVKVDRPERAAPDEYITGLASLLIGGEGKQTRVTGIKVRALRDTDSVLIEEPVTSVSPERKVSPRKL